jgi:DNA-binding SARP family transcriptional activator
VAKASRVRYNRVEMEFRLLGPLEVRDGERAIQVGGGKERALLALLLLSVGRVVPTDRLTDDLWGERPPATAAKALQLYVSHLRKALGTDAIVTRAPGYALRIDREQLDAHRFERLFDLGRAASEGGDARAAARLFGEALSLWRGPALADLAFEGFAQPEIARLEELRLAALQQRVDADLALGRHAELVAELEGLVARHPLRERPRAQLMLALYRCGRQAEALGTYRDGRRALVDELGIEPGAELQELERAMLNQDPALGAPAAPPPQEPAAPPVGAAPEEHKLVSVLCATFQAEHDPERLRELLERAFAAAGEEVAAAGGRLEPAAGPTVLATFGATASQEDHAQRATAAALALIARLRAEHGEFLRVRVGLESGDAVVGPAGPGRPGVVGAAVGEAARLAQEAAPGELRLGPRAAAAARAGARDRPGRVFVGRAAELDLLETTHRRVIESGQPHVVTVLGEPGVGKSSLLRALRRRLPPDTRWYVGRCPTHGRAITYRPLVDILRARLDLDPSDPPELVRRRLGERSILGLALGLEGQGDLHPFEAREQLHEALLEVLGDIARDGPAVVVIEDLHWAEDALLELLVLASRRVAGPLLLLGSARPELAGRSSAWVAERNASWLWLEPFNREEAEHMLAELAGELPARVCDLVLDRAEGNPFFVEEALAALLDRGALRREAGGWAVDELPERWLVSDTVHAVLAARVDLLPSAEKQALQAAAVIGRVFWDDAVRQLVDEHVDLALLEERDFVRRRPAPSLPGQREYAFKHALTREVAYASLPLGRRTRLHARFAEWLEGSGGSEDAHAPMLAHHYAEAIAPAHVDLAWAQESERAAALRVRALRWLRRAAELAFARYELADATDLYRQAAAIAPDDVARGELLEAAARASVLRFDSDGYRSTMEEALALTLPREVAARLYASLSREGSRPYMWKHPPSRDAVKHWIERALQLAEPGSPARAAAVAARAQLDPATQAEAAREGVELAERLGDPYLLADAYETASHVATAHGRVKESAALADRKLALVPRISDPDRRAAQYAHATFAYLRAGRVSDGRQAAEAHDAGAAGLTVHHEVHGVAFLLVADTVGGAWQHAGGLTARAETACAANTDTPCQFNWRSLLMAALAHAQLGDDVEARRLEACAADARQVGGQLSREPSLLRLAVLRGELEAAARLLAAEPAIDFWDVDYPAARLDALVALGDRRRVEADAKVALGRAGYVEPFALRALGVVREDVALIERAAASFDALGLGWRADETRALSAAV